MSGREIKGFDKRGSRPRHWVPGEKILHSLTNFREADLKPAASNAGLTIAAQIMTSKGFDPEYFHAKAVYLDSATTLEPDNIDSAG